MSGFFPIQKSSQFDGTFRGGVKIDFQERMERVRALTDQLEAGITGLFQSGQYAAYLQSLSKLHHYSYGNIFLIKLQCSHASMVGGVWGLETEIRPSCQGGRDRHHHPGPLPLLGAG